MANIKDCPGFETFGEDVRAGREAQGIVRKALAEMVASFFASISAFFLALILTVHYLPGTGSKATG